MWSAVRKTIIHALLILAAYLMQHNLFAAIGLIRTTPNLLLLITVASGLIEGRTEGMLTGFFCGILADMFGGSILGYQALILTATGYFCGFFTPYFDMDMITLPLGVLAVSDFIYGFYIYVTRFLIRGRFGLFAYLRLVILPEMIYTLVILVIVYRLLLRVFRLCGNDGKRRSAEPFD